MMTDSDRLQMTHRWFDEVWNKGNVAIIDEMLDPNCIVYGIMDPEGNHVQGAAGFTPFFLKFRNAFPDIHITVEDCLVKGDKVASRCRVQGTHTGDGLGVAATGKRIDFTGMCIVRIEDGRVMEAWNNFDFMVLYQQIGLLPTM